MPPPKNGRRKTRGGAHPANTIVDSINGLVEAVTGLIGSIGHAAANAAVTLRGTKMVPASVAKVPGTIAKKSERLRKSIKAHWAAMTPEQREARIRKMLAGRGLKRGGGAKAQAKGKAGPGRGKRRGPGRPPKSETA